MATTGQCGCAKPRECMALAGLLLGQGCECYLIPRSTVGTGTPLFEAGGGPSGAGVKSGRGVTACALRPPRVNVPSWSGTTFESCILLPGLLRFLERFDSERLASACQIYAIGVIKFNPRRAAIDSDLPQEQFRALRGIRECFHETVVGQV